MMAARRHVAAVVIGPFLGFQGPFPGRRRAGLIRPGVIYIAAQSISVGLRMDVKTDIEDQRPFSSERVPASLSW